MHVRVTEEQMFHEFCQHDLVNVEVPSFQKPTPVPMELQQKIMHVFSVCGCTEISVHSFGQQWNQVFPSEHLHCRDYGYRDVKGLLANVPIIEKVGTKLNAKYVLKCSLINGPHTVTDDNKLSHPTLVDPTMADGSQSPNVVSSLRSVTYQNRLIIPQNMELPLSMEQTAGMPRGTPSEHALQASDTAL